MNKYRLRMIFEDNYGGVIHQACIDVSECIAQDFVNISPPMPMVTSFDTCVRILKKKQLRKG